MYHQDKCSHQWTQSSPFVPNWAQQTPTPACPSKCEQEPVAPNPVLTTTATLQMCTPIQLVQTSPTTVLVTVSIPAEVIFTLPTKALEIKNIKKSLKVTQCRVFNFSPLVPGKPQDTPKLFLGGFVRKDIQYSETTSQTAHTVEGTIKDFVVDIPYTCVVDLGHDLVMPPTQFNQQLEYTFSSSDPLPTGFSPKDKLLSGDISELNMVSTEFLNTLPTCKLVYSQINEMDDAIDRVLLKGGPFAEGTFRTVQEKMMILIQLRLTFDTAINPICHQKDCKLLSPCELPILNKVEKNIVSCSLIVIINFLLLIMLELRKSCCHSNPPKLPKPSTTPNSSNPFNSCKPWKD